MSVIAPEPSGMFMSRPAAMELVRQLSDAVNGHDVPRLMEFYADDAVAVSPVFTEVRGREAIAKTWSTIFETFPDWTISVSNVLVDGNRLAFMGTAGATDRVGWFGLPPTGGPIHYRAVIVCTIADGKIVHEERVYDLVGVVERLEKARMDKELTTAAAIQRALVPRTAHVGPFCHAVGDSVPCRAIGGDFFEFVELPSGDFGVALADVSGKGPAAALLAAMLQGMFTAEAQAGNGPSATLARMNRALAARRLESRFATLVYGVLSPDGRFVYSNAGHNPPALVSSNGIRRLSVGGPILGAFAGAAFEEEALVLNHQDTVVMFTDGVTEARSEHDEEFGEDRLLSALDTYHADPPPALLDRIFGAVREFCQPSSQTDDITVMVMRFR